MKFAHKLTLALLVVLAAVSYTHLRHGRPGGRIINQRRLYCGLPAPHLSLIHI